LLRRSEDIHCLVFHYVTLLGYGCAFYLYLNPHYAGIEGPWSRAAFVLAAALMLAWCCGLDVPVNFHNHAHKPLFRSPWLNRWCGRLWTFSSGWPSFFFEHVHVTVHHANLLQHEDWTLPRRRPDGRFENVIRYSLGHWPWRFAYHLYRDFTSTRYPPGTGKKALTELAIFLALWSIPFWINVEMALVLWVFPQWLGNVTTSGAGMYAQHAGCVRPSAEYPHSHSNSSFSRFHNLTMFNLGYHMAHHTHPQVHWTDLPKVHDHMMRKIDTPDPRLFAVSYYTMANSLVKAGLGVDTLDRDMIRQPRSGEPVPARFDLATPADYDAWRGDPSSES
jgi:fatty acid desaturase